MCLGHHQTHLGWAIGQLGEKIEPDSTFADLMFSISISISGIYTSVGWLFLFSHNWLGLIIPPFFVCLKI
jgi:hypothetical protein